MFLATEAAGGEGNTRWLNERVAKLVDAPLKEFNAGAVIRAWFTIGYLT